METQFANYGLRKHLTHFHIIYILIAYTIWIFVNIKFGIMTDLLYDSTLKGTGVTPILTYATYPFSILLGVFTIYELHGKKYYVLYALSAPILAIVVFEILWHFFGFFTTGFPYSVNNDGYIILLSWVFLGTISFKFWKFNWIVFFITSFYVMLWIAWVGFGYPQIANGSNIAYFFNFILKIMTFLLIMSLFLGIKRKESEQA